MNGKIVLIWVSVVVLAAGAIVFFNRMGASVMASADAPIASAVGRLEVDRFFPIEKDIELTRQDGESVMLSEIQGKVTVMAQFFAVCPMCAERNAVDLVEIYETFRDHPDFQMVCVTVDPKTDGVEQLAGYAEALGADVSDWWFVTAGDEAKTHEYLEEELKFLKIRERGDPVDIASQGKFSHDLALLVIDREMNVIGKWPLAEARSEAGRERNPGLYEKLREALFARLNEELGKTTAEPTAQASEDVNDESPE